MSTDAPTAVLLREVFGPRPATDPGYVNWLYRLSPFGPVVEANLDDEHGRAAHYAVVPCPFTNDGVERAGALSLNTAVHERARGKGMFTRLAEATYGLARERGIRDVVGVANANSTPGFVRRLGFTLVGPLPVRVMLPRGVGRGVRSTLIDGDLLGSSAFRRGLEVRLSGPDPSGLARVWKADTLCWRLSCPTARYAWHEHESAAVITAVTRQGGIQVAIVLKVLSQAPLSTGAARSLISAACRFHRAPVALHAGVQPHLPLSGLTLPDRLRPSPLNFIHRNLDGNLSSRLGVFEFLDFDAY